MLWEKRITDKYTLLLTLIWLRTKDGLYFMSDLHLQNHIIIDPHKMKLSHTISNKCRYYHHLIVYRAFCSLSKINFSILLLTIYTYVFVSTNVIKGRARNGSLCALFLTVDLHEVNLLLFLLQFHESLRLALFVWNRHNFQKLSGAWLFAAE